jgi:transposase
VLSKSGAGVYAVNPRELKLISHSKRKTDKYDSRVLADLLRCNGLPEQVYMPKEETLKLRSTLKVRKWLVRQKSQTVTRAKAMMRQIGVEVTARMFHTERSWDGVFNRLTEWAELLRPIYEVWKISGDQLKDVESKLREMLPESEEKMAILMTIPGIGPVTAWTLIASVEDVRRFHRADQLVSYAGLVPSQDSSGERQKMGSITKRGRSDLRDVYIQAAWAVLRSNNVNTVSLKRFFYRIMRKRCSQVAVVALAKKLLLISYYVLKQRKSFAVKPSEY